tara:strand:+ start:840 stop:1094 length:255 start_codon:yes stop_codon:yes gene_type:complete
MGRKKPSGPSPEEIARAQEKARREAEEAAKKQAEQAEREAQARFASSEERKRQKKRTGKRKLIATPYGYLGDTSEFGSKGSLLG